MTCRVGLDEGVDGSDDAGLVVVVVGAGGLQVDGRDGVVHDGAAGAAAAPPAADRLHRVIALAADSVNWKIDCDVHMEIIFYSSS